MSAEDKKALTNGYAPLKQLSQALINAIEAQKGHRKMFSFQKIISIFTRLDLPAGEQHFGQAFMELKERFFSSYAYLFRCVEQISAIVENVLIREGGLMIKI